ncbi:peptidase M48 [Enemella dayhoffiae]|uniref:Peptidase M48 n=1 Tax=Enemella dayhoffiae TaxID=2016507 RepID=A0A255HB10_9ACTN|nr:M48 family metallopeptidase [Enemella dayhoffiae]OYO24960.1 peptidase M48 [Enemella dayhoffiae]
MSENTSPTRKRIILHDISSRAWEHPADRGALVALRKLQGFDTIVRKWSGFINERMVKMLLLGSNVRVSERQFPRVHKLYAEAGQSLDVADLPELYVSASPLLNAYTIGMDTPRIVVNSALVDLMDDDELRFVLGHELGHALSGHALYRTLLAYLIQVGATLAGGIPFGYWGIRAIIAALGEWARKAELSGDRAGLLATQDVGAAIRVQMKLASGGHLADLDQTEFLEQAREYDATEDLRDSVMKFILIEETSHPYAVMRAGELRKWVDSGEYAEILSGNYPRRQQDRDARISEEAAAAAESYLSAFRSSQDSIVRLARDLGDGLGEFGRWIGGRFKQGPPNQ